MKKISVISLLCSAILLAVLIMLASFFKSNASDFLLKQNDTPSELLSVPEDYEYARVMENEGGAEEERYETHLEISKTVLEVKDSGFYKSGMYFAKNTEVVLLDDTVATLGFDSRISAVDGDFVTFENLSEIHCSIQMPYSKILTGLSTAVFTIGVAYRKEYSLRMESYVYDKDTAAYTINLVLEDFDKMVFDNMLVYVYVDTNHIVEGKFVPTEYVFSEDGINYLFKKTYYNQTAYCLKCEIRVIRTEGSYIVFESDDISKDNVVIYYDGLEF